MAQSLPFTYINTTAETAKDARVPAANPTGGMNRGSTPGIGVGNTGDLTGQDQWTLLDQYEDARTPQVSQFIGGLGVSDPSESNGVEGNGAGETAQVIRQVGNPILGFPAGTGPSVQGRAFMDTLAAGWTSQV